MNEQEKEQLRKHLKGCEPECILSPSQHIQPALLQFKVGEYFDKNAKPINFKELFPEDPNTDFSFINLL